MPRPRSAGGTLNGWAFSADAAEMLRHRPGLLALVAVSALLPAAVLHRAGSVVVPVSGTDHFMFVAVGAFVAALASAGLTTAGVRSGDGRTVLLGTALWTMTVLLAVHGFATPGVIVGPNGVIAFAGGASLPAGGVVLALSALPSLRRPRRMAPLLALQAGLAIGIVALGTLGLAIPSLVPSVPKTGSAEAIPVMLLGVSLFALLAHRALRTFALTRRATDLVVALGCAWLAFASFTSLTTMPGTLGFYLGHLLELIGVVLVGIPVAIDLRRGGASRPLVGDLSAAEVVASEEAYLGAR